MPFSFFQSPANAGLFCCLAPRTFLRASTRTRGPQCGGSTIYARPYNYNRPQ